MTMERMEMGSNTSKLLQSLLTVTLVLSAPLANAQCDDVHSRASSHGP